MISDIPLTHQEEAYKLDATGLVELFQITLQGGGSVLYFTPYLDCTWQGHTWESFPCRITEMSTQSMGENSRPKLTLANPDGLFSGYVISNMLDNATVVRYRVSPDDVATNTNRFMKNTWRISKVVALNKNMIVIELRSAMDGHYFKLPGNSYFPPEYPHVSLQ